MATMNGQDAGMADAHISSLRDLLSGTTAHVLTPSDNGYEKSIERWSRAAEKPAGVCIVPTSTAEVATAVKYATTNHLDIAVKGGGHSTSGASSTHGGILIDLGRMRNVRVDEQNQLLYVQGGALWSDVDAAAWEYGLATVGGTVADTGVGGLTLGGGYGVLSGLYGLVIDNLVGATVVLASGEVKHASRDENPDLLWALQGAGQNFGVTTEFVLQAYPQKETYQGTMLFPCTPANISAVVSFMNDLFAVHQADTSSTTSPGTKTAGRALVLFGLAKPAPMDYQTVLLVNAHYAGSKADGLACYQPLLDLNPIMNTMGMAPYPNANKLVPAAIGMRSSMKGAAFVLPIREAFVTDMIASFDAFHSSCPDAGDSIIAWELFDPRAVVASETGAFANRGWHLNSLVMPMWRQTDNDARCRQWARELSLRFKDELEQAGERTSRGVEGGASVRGHKGAVMLYGNYDQYDEKARDIFGDNYPRLQALKAKYDPRNVFNKLFAITPQGPDKSVQESARL